MYYIVETQKSFHQASTDLESAVTRNGFGVLHIHDLGTTLRSKGIAFEEECKVFEDLQSGPSRKSFIHRYAPEYGVTVSYFCVHGKRPNEDWFDQANANALRAI